MKVADTVSLAGVATKVNHRNQNLLLLPELIRSLRNKKL